jgi:dolichol-phosphate mannosyltransferase
MRTIVIIPAKDEEKKIGIVVSGILKYAEELVDEVIVIDDGSSDKTAIVAEKNGATVISHPKNKGVGAAIRTGIDYAIQNNFGICVVMGGDAQDDPREMYNVVSPIINDGYDFVQGSRVFGNVINFPIFRKITTYLFSLFFNIATGVSITDASNGYRAFRTKLVKDPRINLHQDWLNRYELEPYLLIQAIKRGYKITEAPVTKMYFKEVGYSKMKPIVSWWHILKPLIQEFLRISSK